MKQYLDLLQDVINNGERRKNRTGIDTLGVFGRQLRVDLRTGFPLLTTKRVPFRSVVAELLWFLSGDTNAKTLQDQGVTIWDEWATVDKCAKFGRRKGDLGPIYGHQWRNFGASWTLSGIGKDGFDQIAHTVNRLITDPNSRRHVVTAWHPLDAELVELPPCHTLFQFYVSNAKALSCHLHARSIDIFLGLPFNIASYALLTHAMAYAADLSVGELIISFGDLHLYTNHLDQAQEQLSRSPKRLPVLTVTAAPGSSIFSLRPTNFVLDGYDPHPSIKAQVAV